MPRQIIDVESSRPAYVRRRLTTWIVAVAVIVAAAVAAWLTWGHHALPVAR
ncbi:MAG TPA: hypothetical protein VJP76_02195 [Candidatus Tumulicola sp.]|nr:hypothetical protein [Candidatus Tumulicola sp.]